MPRNTNHNFPTLGQTHPVIQKRGYAINLCNKIYLIFVCMFQMKYVVQQLYLNVSHICRVSGKIGRMFAVKKMRTGLKVLQKYNIMKKYNSAKFLKIHSQLLKDVHTLHKRNRHIEHIIEKSKCNCQRIDQLNVYNISSAYNIDYESMYNPQNYAFFTWKREFIQNRREECIRLKKKQSVLFSSTIFTAEQIDEINLEINYTETTCNTLRSQLNKSSCNTELQRIPGDVLHLIMNQLQDTVFILFATCTKQMRKVTQENIMCMSILFMTGHRILLRLPRIYLPHGIWHVLQLQDKICNGSVVNQLAKAGSPTAVKSALVLQKSGMPNSIWNINDMTGHYWHPIANAIYRLRSNCVNNNTDMLNFLVSVANTSRCSVIMNSVSYNNIPRFIYSINKYNNLCKCDKCKIIYQNIRKLPNEKITHIDLEMLRNDNIFCFISTLCEQIEYDNQITNVYVL